MIHNHFSCAEVAISHVSAVSAQRHKALTFLNRALKGAQREAFLPSVYDILLLNVFLIHNVTLATQVPLPIWRPGDRQPGGRESTSSRLVQTIGRTAPMCAL